MRVLHGAVVVLAAAVLPLNVHADIYRCIDREGGLHFVSTRKAGMRCSLASKSSKPQRARPAASASRPAVQGPVHQPPPSLGKDPHRYLRYDPFIREASRLYALPEPFIRAVIKVESDFNPNVVSRVGAMGMMQLMPRTAANMGVQSPFDPRQNILGGSRYLRVLANKFNGDLVLTVASYNAGEGAVMRYRGVPPYTETRRYVRRVLTHYYSFRAIRSPGQ